jgi:hypothetical protein
MELLDSLFVVIGCLLSWWFCAHRSLRRTLSFASACNMFIPKILPLMLCAFSLDCSAEPRDDRIRDAGGNQRLQGERARAGQAARGARPGRRYSAVLELLLIAGSFQVEHVFSAPLLLMLLTPSRRSVMALLVPLVCASCCCRPPVRPPSALV